jgi:hypothetical protein
MPSFLQKVKEKLPQLDKDHLRNYLKRYSSILLFCVVTLVYLANGKTIWSGDTISARFLPFSILRELDFDLDEFPFLYDLESTKSFPVVASFFNGEDIPYFLVHRNGHYISVYPPGPALLALPVYALPVVAGISATSNWLPYLEKLSATLIAALSVLFLYWALGELVAEKTALIIAIIYAFGTSTFSLSSQALWQHGPGQCLLSLALYFCLRGIKEDRFIPFAILALACSIVIRPTNVLIALPFGLYVLHKYPHLIIRSALFALPPLMFLCAYNYVYFGSVMSSGYNASTLVSVSSFSMPFFEGLSGLLLSPGRGLFIYSPILIFSIVGIVKSWNERLMIFRYLTMALVCDLILYSKYTWWGGGFCYGPRMLAELTPILCLFLYPIFKIVERRCYLRLFFLALSLVSISFHALGAFWYDGSWDTTTDLEAFYDRVWSWTNNPLVYYGRAAYYGLGARFHKVKELLSSFSS